MNISIIGYGTMGAMLLKNIMKSDLSIRVTVSNRSKIEDRLVSDNIIDNTLADNFKNITVEYDYKKAVSGADIIFLCVQPKACIDILSEISSEIPINSLLISIAADLTIKNIEKYFSGKIMRIMPTLTSNINLGTTLLVQNRKVDFSDLELVKNLFGPCFNFMIVEEASMDTLSGITSCGPGIFSAIFNEYIKSICRIKELDESLVAELTIDSIISTCLLSKESEKNFQGILSEVATIGGVTEKGAEVLFQTLPNVFEEMNSAMLSRHKERQTEIDHLVMKEE
jgi:pyrroline-5-carboxylate reductase